MEQVSGVVLWAGCASSALKARTGLDCTIMIGRVITPYWVCVFGLYLRESDVSGLR